MSFKALRAAFPRRLPPTAKLLLLHMANEAADTTGVVIASVRTLARLTGLCERSVHRTRDWLCDEGFVERLETGGGKTVPRYRLPLEWSGVPDSQGCQTVRGDNEEVSGVSHSRASDPSYVPTKSRKAEAAPPRLEIPTRDQVTKLVYIELNGILNDPDPTVERRDVGDLAELVKKACARAHFVYNGDIVNDGINRVLAARGQNPSRPLDVTRLRSRG